MFLAKVTLTRALALVLLITWATLSFSIPVQAATALRLPSSGFELRGTVMFTGSSYEAAGCTDSDGCYWTPSTGTRSLDLATLKMGYNPLEDEQVWGVGTPSSPKILVVWEEETKGKGLQANTYRGHYAVLAVGSLKVLDRGSVLLGTGSHASYDDYGYSWNLLGSSPTAPIIVIARDPDSFQLDWGKSPTVFGLNYTTGKQVWTFSGVTASGDSNGPSTPSAMLVEGQDSGGDVNSIAMLDINTGKMAWSDTTGPIPSGATPCVDGGCTITDQYARYNPCPEDYAGTDSSDSGNEGLDGVRENGCAQYGDLVHATFAGGEDQADLFDPIDLKQLAPVSAYAHPEESPYETNGYYDHADHYWVARSNVNDGHDDPLVVYNALTGTAVFSMPASKVDPTHAQSVFLLNGTLYLKTDNGVVLVDLKTGTTKVGKLPRITVFAWPKWKLIYDLSS